MTTQNYDLTTARAVCNDATKDTYEVQAKGSDGRWWTVSDSSQMTRDEAESMAESMRSDDK